MTLYLMELIFIYNAGSGIFNTVSDFAYKIISPSTYPRTLCALTYGNLGMKTKWSEFTNSLSMASTFLHKDELDEYNLPDIQYPAILLKKGILYSVLADAKTLNDLASVNALIDLVQTRLQAHLQPVK